MNAHALLTSQGWRGTGHSLHHSSDTIGLSRPLLVSKKDNLLGVGKKMHKTADMWWLNAFDASLKGLDTSKEGQVKVQEGGGLEMVVKGGSKWVGGKGGLYSFFVRGETVGGTMDDKEKEKKAMETIVKEEKSGKGKGKDKKRKGEERKESKEERRARKEKKRVERARKSAAKEAKKIKGGKEAKAPSASSTDSEKTETKEERRVRKEQKRQKKLLRQSEKESSDTSSASESAKKKKSRKNK
ncbi:hypothetical protein BHYA_0128g00050 [Botrytis hyacinthi]|uniref:G-patch domain-containing protein n=1 Tax=Botrytis hyacinthi TaxID=278943 RepID=A0A4Z1GJD3_9HELO|nr:hypothetical protein BHYA_0128g00050 [Botrytis hyacinthi]